MSFVPAAPTDIEPIIRSVVEAKIADKGSVQLVAELLRQVFVDGKSVDDVVHESFLPSHIFEGYIQDVQAVLDRAGGGTLQAPGPGPGPRLAKFQNRDRDRDRDPDPRIPGPRPGPGPGLRTTPPNATPQDSATECDSDDALSLRLDVSDDDFQEDAEFPAVAAEQDTPNGTEKREEDLSNSESVSEQPAPSSGPLKNYGKAVATPDGCIAAQSKRFPGVVLQFHEAKGSRGPKPSVGVKYRCVGCFQLAEKFDRLGISMRTLRVVDGEIVDRDPDNAGTSHGHLCQTPEMLEQLEEEFALRRRSGRERRPPQSGDTNGAESTADSGLNEEPSGSEKTPATSKKEPARKRRHESSKKKADTDLSADRSADGEAQPPTPKRVRFAKAVKTPKVEVAAEAQRSPSVDENVHGVAALSKADAAATEAKGNDCSAKAADDYSVSFGKAIKTDDPSVVLYDNIFGGMFTFKLVHEKEVMKGGVKQVIRTYRCDDCVKAAQKQALRVDVPLVKTINDEFVERDPDQPLGNIHLCTL